MAFLLKETFKFPKDNFKSMKYQPYELKPSFSMYRVYEWYQHWNGISRNSGICPGVHGVVKKQISRTGYRTGDVIP